MNEHECDERPPRKPTARLRLRRVRSRSKKNTGCTILGRRGEPMVRVWLRVAVEGKVHDSHLGQAVLGVDGRLDRHALGRLFYRCGARLEALGQGGEARAALLLRLREALTSRGWLLP